MNLFRIRGIRLAVHFSFFLWLAYWAENGWLEDRWAGMGWKVAQLLAFFTCVVLHELGHSFAAMRFGIGVRRILLMPIGGMAEMDGIPRKPSRELLVTLAGPAVNFAIAALLWTRFSLADLPGEDATYSTAAFFAVLLLWNLIMGIFNLLPAFPMDGGRILRAMLAVYLPYVRATKVAATVGKIVCVLAVLLGWGLKLIGIVDSDAAALYTVLFGFIFLVGEMELRAVQHRELEDAHVRAMQARAYATTRPAPAEEPPVLAA